MQLSAASVDELTPAAVAEDPAAAEHFHIEKRLLSAAADKINSPSARHGISGTQSHDSFDWLGDDKDLYELNRGFYTGSPTALDTHMSLYDNAQPDNPQNMQFNPIFNNDEDGDDGDAHDDATEHHMIPRRIHHICFLALQMSLIVVATLGALGIELGAVAGVSVHYWCLLMSLIIFSPLITAWFIQFTVKRMRHSPVFEGGELPNFVDALKMPLVMLTSTLVTFSFWFKYFPRGCPNARSPMDICWFAHADKLFYGLVLSSLGLALEMTCMFFATLKFHERTFKSRIINCRFKIYIIQQLALKALEAEQRTHINSVASGMLASVSQPSLDYQSDEDAEGASYLDDLSRYIRSWLQGSSILHRSRRAIGSAAAYVQIQVEDEAPAVPVAHASSQSYSKFSRKLKKHMQLYGYSQFAQNRSGLREHESKLLAKDLFAFLCPPERSHLVPEDMMSCFASARAAKDAFDIFDQDQDGTVSKKEFRSLIVSTYADLRDLTESVKNAGSALDKLDVILKTIVIALLFLTILAMLSINVTNMLTLSLSVVIGLNFIFGDIAKHFFHSIILLFVNHPFDIGDTIVVGLFEEGVYLKDILNVKHINLMTTVFLRWNGQETYVPNHLLASAPFMTNLSRSVEQWEKINFKLPSTTPENKLAQLRGLVGAFLRQNDKEFFHVFDMHAIVAADTGHSENNLDELKFTLRVKCRPTSDSQRRWARHARLIQFVKLTLERSIIASEAPLKVAPTSN